MATISRRIVRGTAKFPPAGLRDAVLRASVEAPSHRMRATRRLSAVGIVRCWQDGLKCTPEQWQELQRLCGVPDDWMQDPNVRRPARVGPRRPASWARSPSAQERIG